MARFISILSGSNPSLAFHDVRTISNGTALRAGLIASRSALSADIYAELLPENQSGAKGVFFPVDLISTTAVAGQITGSAYTSSRAGIVTPADYSIRPTASVLSTTSQVAPTNPLNRASASLVTYESASVAVATVLGSIQDGGPYGRIGLNPSRTLHTVYHDPETRYFAWDDFTPGTPNTTNTTVGNSAHTDAISSNTNVVYLESGVDTFRVTGSWTTQFSADILGTATVFFTLEDDATGQQLAATSSTVSGLDAAYAFPSTPFAQYSQSQGVIGASYQVRFSDVTIPSHQGNLATYPFASLGVRAQILHRRTDARTTSSAGFNPSTFCDRPTTTAFTINTAASSSRLYADKSGSVFVPNYAGYNPGDPHYVAFGELITGQTVFLYDAGQLLSTTTTITCDTGGTTTTTTTTTAPPLILCVGSQFGVCEDDETPYCCENNGTFSCFSTVCAND
jgi:hypothetical protein